MFSGRRPNITLGIITTQPRHDSTRKTQGRLDVATSETGITLVDFLPADAPFQWWWLSAQQVTPRC